jgi:hypothetical protein
MSLTAAAGTRFTRPAMVGMCVSFVVIGPGFGPRHQGVPPIGRTRIARTSPQAGYLAADRRVICRDPYPTHLID